MQFNSLDFCIEKKLYAKEPFGPYVHYEYKLLFTDGHVGDYCVYVDTVRKSTGGFSRVQYKKWLKDGIKPTDLCVTLDDFYPNGRGDVPNRDGYMRKGFGKFMLDQILAEYSSFNAKLIIAAASTEYIKNFFKKYGWETGHCCHNWWFRRLY